jgi:hypothetical protein
MLYRRMGGFELITCRLRNRLDRDQGRSTFLVLIIAYANVMSIRIISMHKESIKRVTFRGTIVLFDIRSS